MDVQLWPDETDRPLNSSVDSSPSRQVLLATCLAALVLMGIAAQVSYLVEKRSEEMWLATAEIEYRGNSLVETISVAMNSPSLWGPIAQQNGIEPKDFEKRYRAQVVGGTQVLLVEFEDPDPEKARQVVTEAVDSFLLQFTEVDDSGPNETLERYLESLRVSEAELLKFLTNTPDLSRTEQIDRQRELLALRQEVTAVLLRLDGRSEDFDELTRQQPRVISAPFVLPEPVKPTPRRMAILGAVGGLVLSFGAAFVLFHRNESSRLEEDLDEDWELAA